ncbi:heat shock 70 kDa protein 12B-like [Cyanistes caeruleus]|uniref:heat shock 70 kDa protein 12B-like n=1 Tax=Cyanistes caeruleus TaxID=156563 RepID=UPI000CDAFE76|nr:heat shock 70 kDa protein 12B-like [Cyanistes caeruleus]
METREILTSPPTPGSAPLPAREQLRRSRHSRTFLVESGVGELWSEMQAGDRYIVADCGGGTVDLTVHQIEKPQGTLKELYKASGGMGVPFHPFFPRPGVLPGHQTRAEISNPGWDPKSGLGP